MAEYAVMPAADYKDACDAVREKTGGTAQIVSGELGEQIRSISGGGGINPPDSEILDPDEVYRTTRPKDWLPMPTPGDDEIYLLGHIPDGLSGSFTARLNWRNGGSCLVEIGTIENGVFVAKEVLDPPKNTQFSHPIAKDAYGNVTADGSRQYMVHLKGDITEVHLQRNFAIQSGVYSLVDFVSGVQAWYGFGSTNFSNEAQRNLRYARFVGNGGDTGGVTTFSYCVGLKSVSADKEVPRQYSWYSFLSCKSLVAISPNLLVSGAIYGHTFRTCSRLVLPKKHFTPQGVEAMLVDAQIRKVDGAYVDTSAIKDFTQFFYNSGVEEAVNINISSATSVHNAFALTSFARLTFAGETTPGGWTISVTSGKMFHDALVEMINSLPVALEPAIIAITGNPGASELTEDEIAVATAKNWTITI